MAFRALLVTAMALTGPVQGLAGTDTITWGGDNSRTGYQTNHNMDPAVVSGDQFGQLFRTQLPGVWVGQPEQVFSQPLVYTPQGGSAQFVYFATTQNNVYKLDAHTGKIVLSRNLHIPFLTADLEGCVDINPTIGITATGVIDPETDTLYLTAKTYVDQSGGETAQGRDAGRYYVHALDVNDLSERPNFPVLLDGAASSSNPDRIFQGGIHHQRPGLLQTGNFIYAGFASHCVQYNFTGWIIGWEKTTGKIVESWSTEGQGVADDIRGGGIWMSGGGIASDDNGSIFLATGNGYASQQADAPVKGFNPPTSLEEAALHMTINGDGSLRVVDFFMPWEKRALDGADKDLGASPLEILPSQFSCGAISRIGVVTGKSGKTYFLNLDNLGGYKNGNDGLDNVIYVYENLNSVYAGAGVYPLEGGYIYINVVQHPTIVFKFSCDAGVPSFVKVSETSESNAYILGVSHGTTTSLNGQPGTGLLWITDVQGYGLRVYNAVPQAGNMTMIKSFNIPAVTKFSRPVFGDGTVYVGTTVGYVYGFGSPVNVPLNCTSPTDFGTANVHSGSLNRTVSCKALIPLTITGVGLNDAASKDFSIVDKPSGPVKLAAHETFTIEAEFSPLKVGLVSNDILVNTSNSDGGFSSSSHVRLIGTGQSSGPMFQLSPQIVTFPRAITGQDPAGISQTVLASNLGNGNLTVRSVLYSRIGTDGPFDTWDREGDLVIGKFTLRKLPATIGPRTAASIDINFNTSTSGTYSYYVKIVTDGGNQTISMAASAGPTPVALFQFQTPDGADWANYTSDAPFTFGNVTENQSRSLKFRVTNAAPQDAVHLSLTVSKPPFGVAGLIRALNQVDLAEGISLAPGESANATLICNVPYAQWNTDPYNGTVQWSMNTNDPDSGKHLIQFFCNAVAEQAPPLLADGLGQYKYAGCWKDNTPGHQLPDQILASDNLTNADCINACYTKGYTFCGTQYRRECWAGNTIPQVKADEAECDYTCAGDVNQICGGNGARMSVFGDRLKWSDNTTQPSDPPADPPVVNPGVSGYASVGCYTDATSHHALSQTKATVKKTVKGCVDACKASYFLYAGVENGGECWCGNSLSKEATSTPMTDCSMACKDDSTEYCGGSARLNVYKLRSAVTTASARSSSVTKVTTATSFPGRAIIRSKRRTNSSTSHRNSTFPTMTRVSNSTTRTRKTRHRSVVTVTKIATSAATAVGTETEGYTSTDPQAGNGASAATSGFDIVAPIMTTADSGNMPDGDAGTASRGGNGGAASTSVVDVGTAPVTTANAVVSYPGGFTDEPSPIAGASTIDVVVVTGTTTAVAVVGTPDTGVERPTNVGTVPNGGGASSVTVVIPGVIDSTAAATATSGPDADPSTGAGTSPHAGASSVDVATPGITPSPATPDHGDNTKTGTKTGRGTASGGGHSLVTLTSTLGDGTRTTITLTVSEGVTITRTISGFTTASPETTSGGSDTVIRTALTSKFRTPPYRNFSTPISHKISRTRAASKSTLRPAKTSTSSAASAPSPYLRKTIGDWAYQGCWTEAAGSRALITRHYADDSMTLDSCSKFCSGLMYFGVEYGRECYCGDVLQSGSARATNQADCSFICPGDSTQFCGAGVRLSLFKSIQPLSSTASTVSFKGSTTSLASSLATSGATPAPGSSGTPSAVLSSISATTQDERTSAVATASSSASAPGSASSSSELSSPVIPPSSTEFSVPAPPSSAPASTSELPPISSEPPAPTSELPPSFTESSVPAPPSSAPASTSKLPPISTEPPASTSELLPSSTESSVPAPPSSSSAAAPTSEEAPSSTESPLPASSSSLAPPVSSSDPVTAPASSAVSSSEEASPSPTSPAMTSVVESTPVSSSPPQTYTQSPYPIPSGPPYINPGNANFAYLGCVSEPSDGRLLDNQPLNTLSMTISLCLETCSTYNYVGVEYGRECWCGNELNIAGINANQPSQIVPNQECSFTCPGNETELCGAGVRLTLYQRKDLVKRLDGPLS